MKAKKERVFFKRAFTRDEKMAFLLQTGVEWRRTKNRVNTWIKEFDDGTHQPPENMSFLVGMSGKDWRWQRNLIDSLRVEHAEVLKQKRKEATRKRQQEAKREYMREYMRDRREREKLELAKNNAETPEETRAWVEEALA